VLGFANASICNKEKVHLNSNDPSSAEIIGTGNETVKFVVYLDSDGSTSGGCALTHNTSSYGYEFRLRYASVWNSNTSKARETFTAYKCDNGNWKVSDIKISAWKKLMCGEIGGPMLAIEKGELSRFPKLYDSTADLRIYVATIGETTNISYPADTSGPGWMTPGTIDFE